MSDTRKTIILGVTAGIAVYKAADLCSRLAKKYNVNVVMTKNSERLISPRIFFTLSQNPVLDDVFDIPAWQPAHVRLAQVADLMVVAPCTANFIGKYTHGIADDALTTTAITFRGKVLLAPAMNTDIYNSPALQDNLKILRERGIQFIGPEEGHLACSATGIGRMSEPADIENAVDKILAE